MEYFVKTITIKTGLFGVKKDKMEQALAAELNSLANQGFEIVSVCPVFNDSSDFDYQVVCKR